MRHSLLAAAGALVALAAAPHVASAQGPALVYCPSNDTGPCGNIVAALVAAGTFSRVERLEFNTTSGSAQIVRTNGNPQTVDAGTNLSGYELLVVPSMANTTSYNGLTNATIRARILAAVAPATGARGRVAGWSGTPDQNTGASANRGRLISNLAGWVREGSTTGLLFFVDLTTASQASRYGWLPGIADVTVGPDMRNASTAECGRDYSIAGAGNRGSITAVAGDAAGAAALAGLAATSDDILASCGFTGGTGTFGVTGRQGSNAAQNLLVTFNTQRTAAVTLGNLEQVFDGTPKPVTVTTDPAGLGVSVTYGGTPTAPTGAGSYAVVATVTQSGYTGSASGTLVVRQAPQAIQLTVPAGPVTFNEQFTVAASATSGLQVLATASGACTIEGVTVTMTSGTGACTLSFAQPGNANYEPAPTRTVEVGAAKQSQTITFGELAGRTFGSEPLTLVATSSAQLPVAFSAGASSACTVSGTTLTITGAGTCAVTATQPGDANYAAAPAVVRAFTVERAPTAFSALAAPAITYGAATATVSGRLLSGALAPTGAVSVVLGTVGSALTTSAAIGPDGAFTATFDASTLPASATGYPVTVRYDATANFGEASDASLKLVVTPRPATISLGGGPVVYSGQPQGVAVTTVPANVQVHVTYDGSATPPTGAGTYAVVATVADGNYSGSATGTFVITKATATLAIDPASLATVFTGQPHGVLVTTAPVGLGAVAITYAGQSAAPTNAGRYAVVATLANPNYQAEPVQGELVIAKATQAITFAALPARTFGDAPFALGATVNSSLAVGYRAEGRCRVEGATLALLGAGSCTVTAFQAGGADHEAAAEVSRTFAIAKAHAAVALAGLQHTYDGTAKQATATTTPAQLAVDVAYARDGQPVASPTRAGRYAVTAAVVSDDYEGTAIAELVIAPKAVTAALQAESKVYDGTTAAIASASLGDGRVGNDDVRVTVGQAAFGDKRVGTGKPVTASVSLDGADAGNYALAATATGAADITARAVTPAVTIADKVYDATPAATIATRTLDAAVLGDDLALLGGVATFGDKHVGSGKQVLVTGLAIEGSDARNYALTRTDAEATASITSLAIGVAATAEDKTYDGTRDARASAAPTGVLAGDVVTATVLEARFADRNVGTGKPVTVTVALAGADAANYTAPTSVMTAVSITARAVSPRITAEDKVYDGTTQATVTPALENVVGGDEVTLTVGAATFAEANVGTHAVTASGLDLVGADAANYALDAAQATATAAITPRRIAVRVFAASKTYGQADPAFAYEVTSGTLVQGDAFSGQLSRQAGEDVGQYAIGQGSLTAGGNYALGFTGAVLTITTKEIAVGAVMIDDKVYDGTTAATITGRTLAAGGVVGSDDVQLVGGTATFVDANVGAAKPVSVSGLALGGAKAGNYVLAATTASASASITARPITVAADAQRATYGDPDPALTYRVTTGELVAGDALSGALTRDPGLTVGTYAIRQGALTAGPNYAVTFVGATLEITRRTASVTPAPQTKTYGAADPQLTGTLSGFLAEDGVTAAYTRTAGETVGGSPYTISATLSPAGVLANYAITYNTASVSITPRPVTVTADAKTKFFGAADPALTYTIASGTLVGGDGFTGSLVRAPGEGVGTYPITQGTLALSPNYALTVLPATLSIQYNTTAGRVFLQPINLTTPRSAFRLGSTIPVKFQLFMPDGTTPVAVARATIAVTRISSSTSTPINEEVVSAAADVGTSFRYDASAGQYIYNLATSSWMSTPGTYRIAARLDDRTEVVGTVEVRSK
jgi:hypothetical protein